MKIGAIIAAHKFATVIVALVLLFWIWIGYLYFTYIDLLTEKGTAYALSIGMSKREAYDRMEEALRAVEGGDGAAFIELPAISADTGLPYGPKIAELLPFERSEGTFLALKESNQWDFYLKRNYRDNLRLTFCNERLCEIYRHRKYFELP